jgi:Spy/CpxP family protein refolding chaperone
MSMKMNAGKASQTKPHRLREVALSSALGAALLVTSSAAMAQPGSGSEPQTHPSSGSQYGARHGATVRRGVDPKAAMLRGLARATERLELDSEQEARIAAIFDDAREQLQANRQAAGDLREELRGIVTAESFDEDALAAAADREGDLSAERVMIAGIASASILAILTEEQRAELELLREEAQGRRRESWRSRRG